jgi:hypothetical protein
MWPCINVLLQAGLSSVIHFVGATGAQATAVNLAGQGMIHGLAVAGAVATGPVGWIVGGALSALTWALL